MKIKPKEITRTVGILTDPTPTWMAIVDHGANQTPFNSVKRDQIAPNHQQQEDTMAIKSGKGAKRKSVIRRLTFSKSQFKAKKDVQAYLDEKGFADTKIVDGDDVWTVESTEDTSKLNLGKAMATATKTAGVTAFVSEVKSVNGADEDEDDADDQDDENEEDEDGEDGDEADEASQKLSLIHI